MSNRFNPGAAQRVIKMVEAQIDPLEPPKHKHTKVPRGPGSPPVPVLHSPPRKLTVADQQAWKVPPCISNWKNSKGFIIPLDKRLAADGRGLQEVTINNKFAMLSESLYIAERKAIQDLNVRNELRKKITLKEKEEREQNLRELANRARLERSGINTTNGDGNPYNNYNNAFDSNEGTGVGNNTAAANRLGLDEYASSSDDDERVSSDKKPQPRVASRDQNSSGEEDKEDIESIEGFNHIETEAEKQARQQRERLRMERRREHERELRLQNMKGNLKKTYKANREEDRDISEKIALGLMKGTGGKLTGESLFDARLFNQSTGMDAGFGPEDEYNTYSRPMFDRGEAASIYRPKPSETDLYGDADAQLAKLSDTSRFRPDKGFQGAEGGMKQAPREAPVQFEKAESRDPYARRGDKEKDRSSRRGRDEEEEDDGRDNYPRGSHSSSNNNRQKRSRYSDDE